MRYNHFVVVNGGVGCDKCQTTDWHMNKSIPYNHNLSCSRFHQFQMAITIITKLVTYESFIPLSTFLGYVFTKESIIKILTHVHSIQDKNFLTNTVKF